MYPNHPTDSRMSCKHVPSNKKGIPQNGGPPYMGATPSLAISPKYGRKGRPEDLKQWIFWGWVSGVDS